MMENRILYKECIRIYKVKESFIDSLSELGLIRLLQDENEMFVECNELEELEQFVRWHNDMDINPEGIEALYYMLDRVKELQSKVEALQSELSFYREI
ncbi:MAG: hypothetical protein GXZ03_07330 [Proteiniphilum sp.]|nr:hypothetical protein [Proteiniphilum sp.]